MAGTVRLAEAPRLAPDSPVGDGNLPRVEVVGALTPSANTTVTDLAVVVPPDAQFVLEAIQFYTEDVPSDADGTVLVDVIERDASADAETVLVDDQDAEALTANEGVDATLATGISLPRILDEHDSIRLAVINNSAGLDNAGVVRYRLVGRIRWL